MCSHFLFTPDTHTIPVLSLQAKNSHCARLVVDKQLCTQQYGITTTKLIVTILHYGVNYDLFFSIPSLSLGFFGALWQGEHFPDCQMSIEIHWRSYRLTKATVNWCLPAALHTALRWFYPFYLPHRLSALKCRKNKTHPMQSSTSSCAVWQNGIPCQLKVISNVHHLWQHDYLI